MKQTLLDITQDILNSMESDEVNSITDTGEALLVAKIIRRAYWDMVGPLDLPEHYRLFQLDASGDTALPVLMTLPTDIMSLEWLKYDKQTTDNTDPNFQSLEFLPLDDFLQRTLVFHESDDEVLSMIVPVNGDQIKYLFTNNAAPRFFTTANDNTIIFDSFDATVDTTLQQNKTLAYGIADTVFTLSDDFVPELDARQFPLLVNEAKSLAFAELKQTQHAKAERTARRQWVSAQKTKRGITKRNYLDELPNYGWKI